MIVVALRGIVLAALKLLHSLASLWCGLGLEHSAKATLTDGVVNS